MGEETGGMPRHCGKGMCGRPVCVSLRGPVQLPTGKQCSTGRTRQIQRTRAIEQNQRTGEFLHRLTTVQAATAGAGFEGLLPIDSAAVFAILFRVDGLDEIKLRFVRLRTGQRRLMRCRLAQGFTQRLGGIELGETFCGIHLGGGDTAALLGSGRGAEQYAFRPAQDAPGIAAPFKALSAISAALGGGGRLVNEVTQIQLAGRRAARQPHTQLGLRIIDHPLIKATVLEIMAMKPGNHPGMIYAGIHPGSKGGRSTPL